MFLRIREFLQRPVTEQADLKARLNAVVGIGSAALQDDERIFLDAPDGAAVVILANPQAALQFATRSLEAARGVPLAIGLNYGPVRVVQGDGAGQIVAGDGISVASSITNFDSPDRIVASRSFREHLLALDPDRGRYLAPAGKIADSGDRTHELYFADDRQVAGRRRRALALCALGAVGILALGIAGHFAVRQLRPAEVELDIKPEGEVVVDGVSKGMTPPLPRLQLAPGKHTIEIRNPKFAPIVYAVDLQPGEQLVLKYSFTAAPSPKPRPKSPIRKFFDRFK